MIFYIIIIMVVVSFNQYFKNWFNDSIGVKME